MRNCLHVFAEESRTAQMAHLMLPPRKMREAKQLHSYPASELSSRSHSERFRSAELHCRARSTQPTTSLFLQDITLYWHIIQVSWTCTFRSIKACFFAIITWIASKMEKSKVKKKKSVFCFSHSLCILKSFSIFLKLKRLCVLSVFFALFLACLLEW